MSSIKEIGKEWGIHLTVVDGLVVLMSIVLIYASVDCTWNNGFRPFVMVEPLLIMLSSPLVLLERPEIRFLPLTARTSSGRASQ